MANAPQYDPGTRPPERWSRETESPASHYAVGKPSSHGTYGQTTTPATQAQPLSQRQLETHLWDAANLLRGKIDSADFKGYIFGLLFYKRLSDVWQEEYDKQIAQGADPASAADPAGHRFHLPASALWRNVCCHRRDIGRRLNVALGAIESANPQLEGVFQEVSFDHRDRFPDATLDLLLRHFERYNLRNCDVETDVLGNAYQYLIAQFADDAGKKGGRILYAQASRQALG